jgi:hypothetical protein
MSLDFSVSSLVAMFVFSVIGLYVFREGKRKVNYTLLFLGIGLMIYPYFTKAAWQDWGVGIALCIWAYMVWPP